MALAETFQEIVDSLPSDWTDMELDLRVDESRYVDAAMLVVTCNAQPSTSAGRRPARCRRRSPSGLIVEPRGAQQTTLDLVEELQREVERRLMRTTAIYDERDW